MSNAHEEAVWGAVEETSTTSALQWGAVQTLW